MMNTQIIISHINIYAFNVDQIDLRLFRGRENLFWKSEIQFRFHAFFFCFGSVFSLITQLFFWHLIRQGRESAEPSLFSFVLINSLDQSIELFCVVKLINNSIYEHHYLVEQQSNVFNRWSLTTRHCCCGGVSDRKSYRDSLLILRFNGKFVAHDLSITTTNMLSFNRAHEEAIKRPTSTKLNLNHRYWFEWIYHYHYNSNVVLIYPVRDRFWLNKEKKLLLGVYCSSLLCKIIRKSVSNSKSWAVPTRQCTLGHKYAAIYFFEMHKIV